MSEATGLADPAAPTAPIATPVHPHDLVYRRIDVAKLVAEINDDLVRLNDELMAAQADTAAAYAAYGEVVAASDKVYNDLLLAQERDRSSAFAAIARAVSDAHAAWKAACAKRQAAEDEISGDIKYVVGLVGGLPSAVLPKLRETAAE